MACILSLTSKTFRKRADSYEDSEVVVAGWGATSEGGFQVPETIWVTKDQRRIESTKNICWTPKTFPIQATVLMEATLMGISNSACGSDYIYDKSLIRWNGTSAFRIQGHGCTTSLRRITIVAQIALGLFATLFVMSAAFGFRNTIVASVKTNYYTIFNTTGRLCCAQWARERMLAKVTVADLLLPGMTSGLNLFRSVLNICLNWGY